MRKQVATIASRQRLRHRALVCGIHTRVRYKPAGRCNCKLRCLGSVLGVNSSVRLPQPCTAASVSRVGPGFLRVCTQPRHRTDAATNQASEHSIDWCHRAIRPQQDTIGACQPSHQSRVDHAFVSHAGVTQAHRSPATCKMQGRKQSVRPLADNAGLVVMSVSSSPLFMYRTLTAAQ